MCQVQYIVRSFFPLYAHLSFLRCRDFSAFSNALEEFGQNFQSLKAAFHDKLGFAAFFFGGFIFIALAVLILCQGFLHTGDIRVAYEDPGCVFCDVCCPWWHTCEKFVYSLGELPRIMHPGIRIVEMWCVCMDVFARNWSSRALLLLEHPALNIKILYTTVEVYNGLLVPCVSE